LAEATPAAAEPPPAPSSLYNYLKTMAAQETVWGPYRLVAHSYAGVGEVSKYCRTRSALFFEMLEIYNYFFYYHPRVRSLFTLGDDDVFFEVLRVCGAAEDTVVGGNDNDPFMKYEMITAAAVPPSFFQVCQAVAVQETDGCFVFKIQDLFARSSQEILYTVAALYEKVYIVKLDTSDPTGADKYVVCIHFRPPAACAFPAAAAVSLTKPLSCFFKTKLEEYNCCFGQLQMDAINNTFLLATMKPDERNYKIQEILKNNKYKCEQWCIKNKI
jgi:hypothetical protein